MNIYIKKNTNYYPIVKYVLKLIEINLNIQFNYLDDNIKSDILWDHENTTSEPIALRFYEDMKNNKIDKITFEKYLKIQNSDNKEDYIATIFYMVNCIQEKDTQPHNYDIYGRFKYESSYQKKQNNIEVNLVQKKIDEISEKWNIKTSKKPSTFFISHDIDTIYGSFFQDGLWAIKNLKIGVILNLLIWELTKNPHWKNIDKIIKINNEKDIKTTFFWLVNEGYGLQNVKNADYKIKNESALLKKINESKFINGLHKSSSIDTINTEIEKSGIPNCRFNRYHFLKFKTHEDWVKISESKLNFDCSLGFAEHYGFRNSYGKAFQPFDCENEKPYNFIEAPLTFMDGTFDKYMNLPRNSIAKTIVDFYEKNQFNCDISLLWHNTHFTNYKYHSFLNEYKKIIEFIYENKIKCVTPDELIKSNTIKW